MPKRKARVNRNFRPATQQSPPADQRFPVVAIGASAGGIEAVSDLLSHLPPDTGMAFVLIQHLDPKHHSILADLLAKHTEISVTEVQDGMEVSPNRLFVIPPNTSMTISDHSLKLRPRQESDGAHMPIDNFMRSLAEEYGSRGIGVILSGSGTDGTLGIAEIQAQGGVTFAQDDATAKYNSMPRSAVNSGSIDYVLSPKQMALELTRLARLPYSEMLRAPESVVSPFDGPALNSIFQMLRRSVGVDFTHYRQTTILRRIQRRMLVHKLDSLEQYVHFLRSNAAEIKSLYQDMLINVTSFFRTPSLFELLKSLVFPDIMKLRPPENVLRLWTPGCASGEETYSLAISLLEFLGDKAPQVPVQIFGTDVSEPSVSKARTGIYPENIQADVSPERLKRFFTPVDGGYRINRNVRNMCVFAQHNVLKDPPFSQMDLICCRNLLIYLEPMLQHKVISLFHYAARAHGFLILGASEGMGSANLFSVVDRGHKIFSKKAGASRQAVTFGLHPQSDRSDYSATQAPTRRAEFGPHSVDLQKEFDRRLVTQYVPATVFVNNDLEVVHTRGNVSRYLKLSSGRASFNVLKMARESLLIELRNALVRAKKEGAPVHKKRVISKTENGNGNGDTHASDHQRARFPARLISFDVIPMHLGPLKELYFMIVFREEPRVASSRTKRSRRQAQREADATNTRMPLRQRQSQNQCPHVRQ